MVNAGLQAAALLQATAPPSRRHVMGSCGGYAAHADSPRAFYISTPESHGHTRWVTPSQAYDLDLEKDTLRINMDITLPERFKSGSKKNKTKNAASQATEKKAMGAATNVASPMSAIFKSQRHPEPTYFQNVDSVGLPGFFSKTECEHIIKISEERGFSAQHRPNVLDVLWTDIIDPFFSEGIWQACGLGWFLRTIRIDGMVACGLNDVVRIQKFEKGSFFGRHTDQHVRRTDGRVSKYSLRVFLNGIEDGAFTGGLTVYHVPFRQDPVILEPEQGLGLLYPQGELCPMQEEAEVLTGCKYVLRADILFCRPEEEGRI